MIFSVIALHWWGNRECTEELFPWSDVCSRLTDENLIETESESASYIFAPVSSSMSRSRLNCGRSTDSTTLTVSRAPGLRPASGSTSNTTSVTHRPTNNDTIRYDRGGQTFSAEGHIGNFIAAGGPHIYFLCLNYNSQRTKIWINDNSHVFCQLNLHTIWPQSSIKINETNVIDPGAIKLI